MLTKKPLTCAVQRALYGAAAVTAAASVAPIAAQAQDEAEGVLEEIVVTGSRIATDANLVTASPVTTVRPEEINSRGITRVEDLLNDLPQITPELTSGEANGATGTATLDLRGLGSDRTLVLTNGHRMGFGDPFALAPDVNQVPAHLIERVELLTGGAAAVYGADAVAGVVNFIMKDDFEGVQLDYQFSGYSHNNDNSAVREQLAASGFEVPDDDVRDGYQRQFNVLMGVNSADGKGNVTGYLGYREIDALTHSQRDYSACALSSSNGETCAGSATIPTGLITPFDGTYFTVAGDQFVPWDYTYYNYGPLNHFQRPDERWTGGLFGHYEFADELEVYTEVQFMDDRSLAQIAPSGAFFITSSIPCENPFLSQQQFDTLGCTSVNDVAAPWYIGRRNVEGGPRFDDLRHTSFRMLLGARGDINDQWSYDVFMNSSRMRFSQVYQNDLSITRITRALDVVTDPRATIPVGGEPQPNPTFGQPICRTVLSGADPSCVPWNVFQTGGVTQAALNYLTLPLFSKADMEQDQFVAYVQGDLTDYGIQLPSAETGVRVIAGVEYRDELMDFNPDQGFTSGDGAGQGGATSAVTGAILVKEFFTEARVPIVQGAPFAEEIALDLRYRRSSYDIPDEDTNTWNIGGEWRPVDSLMIRGGISKAVRAPNIRELFEPSTFGLWAGTDPCAGATPELSQAECANTGVTAAQYGNVPLSPAGQYNAIFGGSLDLEPEESDSFTIGAVFTPGQDVFGGVLEGLTLSVDYWSIELEKAIAAGIGEEFTINQCATTANPQVCGLISRGPNGNLWVGSANIVSQNLNIGFFETAGWDITGTYTFDIGEWGTLDLSLRGTLVDKFDQAPVPEVVQECAGKIGGDCERPRPEWKHIFNASWMTPWDVQLVGAWRYVGEVDQFEGDDFKVDPENYFDLSANYAVDWFGGQTVLNAGISNVFDNPPPVNGFINNISTYSNGNTIPGTWDHLGRYFFLGVTQNF
ncbi:TonB-dependent receptor domain-containing protein [Lentisalinibacter salinarum]|uniref:TonB-dependent receptor domain-containing protein n=1 Tax=Lentisalinibacter salinarum TaxID=2992239 RepID=UPI00386A883F